MWYCTICILLDLMLYMFFFCKCNYLCYKFMTEHLEIWINMKDVCKNEILSFPESLNLKFIFYRWWYNFQKIYIISSCRNCCFKNNQYLFVSKFNIGKPSVHFLLHSFPLSFLLLSLTFFSSPRHFSEMGEMIFM